MNSKFRSPTFYYKLFGDYALFTDPVTKGGGEKFTYQVPTYQALKGITEQIYWKPTIQYYIDAVKVIKPIQTETKGIVAALKNGKKDLNYYTYLRNVEFIVKFHFEWNENRPELDYDRNKNKHQAILQRSIKRGGRRDIFLGTRECVGYIEESDETEFENTISFYKDKQISFGFMFHSFIYPDEAYNEETEGKLTSSFTNIVMKDGVIDFIRPEDCEIHQQLRNYSIKKFDQESIQDVDSTFEEVMKY